MKISKNSRLAKATHLQRPFTERYVVRRTAIAYAAMLLVGSGELRAATAEQASADVKDETSQVVTVTGFRRSLMKAEAMKQESSTIVEAITAEDIGKLPDTSIAESLARLPGVAGERVGGRTTGLSVRGFKEDYVGTTLNGRELLGIGDNRGVEYDLYPAEILSGAVVYKAPEATLGAMGIGGTVDLRTTRPLDTRQNTTLNASFGKGSLKSDNPDYKDTSNRFAFSDSHRFVDDTVGVAIALATTHSPTQAEENGVWSWNRNSKFGNVWTPNGINLFAHSSMLDRDTASAVLQFRPSNKVDVALDALLINFRDRGIKRGFIEQLTDGTVTSVANGAAQAGQTGGYKSTIRSDPTDKKGTLRTYGVNLKLAINSEWKAKFDMAHSNTTKSDEEAESYAGVGRAGLPSQGADTFRNWSNTPNGLIFSNNTTNFSDYNLIRLAGPQSWGGALAPIGVLQPNVSNIPTIGPQQSQDGFVNTAVFDERLDSIRLEAAGSIGDGWLRSVNFGLLYTDHSKSKNNHGYFLTAKTWPLDGPIPDNSRRGVTNLGWAGMGQVVAYDAQSLINSDYYKRWDAQQLEPDRLGDTYTIQERITTLFGKTDFEGSLGPVNVFGNAGLQFVRTNQLSTGYSSQTGANLFVQATPVEDGAKYNKVLPSLNANFDIGHNQMFRLAAAKAISRARIDYLKPGGAVRFIQNVFQVTSTDPVHSAFLSNTGNPKLRPNEANQVDLTYEWYFAKDGYFSLGTFYKDLVNWSRSANQVVDFSKDYIPGYHQVTGTNGVVYTPATFLGTKTYFQDGLKGKVDGVEVAATLPLRLISERLGGFGLVSSASLSNGQLDDGSAIPGLSRKAYQLTAFYERGGFSARVGATYRSHYLSSERGGSNTIVDVNRQAAKLVDAQISYDFSEWGNPRLKGLRISLQGQNLTKQNDTSIDPASGQITQYNHYGATYLLSLKYSL